MPAAEAPVACTLSPAGLAGRLEWIRRVTKRSLLSHRLEGSTLRLRYEPGARADVEQIVAGERECCSFLQFDLQVLPEAVEVTIRAPEGAEADAHWLFHQFLPQRPPQGACGCAGGACG